MYGSPKQQVVEIPPQRINYWISRGRQHVSWLHTGDANWSGIKTVPRFYYICREEYPRFFQYWNTFSRRYMTISPVVFTQKWCLCRTFLHWLSIPVNLILILHRLHHNPVVICQLAFPWIDFEAMLTMLNWLLNKHSSALFVSFKNYYDKIKTKGSFCHYYTWTSYHILESIYMQVEILPSPGDSIKS